MASNYEQDIIASDLEQGTETDAILANTIVSSFSWRSVNVTVRDKQSNTDKQILSNINGKIKAGELLQ